MAIDTVFVDISRGSKWSDMSVIQVTSVNAGASDSRPGDGTCAVAIASAAALRTRGTVRLSMVGPGLAGSARVAVMTGPPEVLSALLPQT